jgi:predicted small metal-binding protein
MKTLACRDVGLDCDNIIKGTTKEDVVKHAEEYAWKFHLLASQSFYAQMYNKIFMQMCVNR